jgi:hypothetical protein
MEESSLNLNKEKLSHMGYSIQVGAFSNVENAVKLTKSLQEIGFDAYYFFHDSNLYKVRFGNYASLEVARALAKELNRKGTIAEYIIIRPEDYIRSDLDETDNNYIRKGIVLSAKNYLGVPYYWGGISDGTGFDCSGLAMAVYKLNGFDLPRTTNEQWRSGNPVGLKGICEGDLVFFSTRKMGDISHVGIYVGDYNFIHAPGEGKKIQIDSLLNEYFESRYMGARTYLR